MTIEWSDEVESIFSGDLVQVFGYVTPAKGVVLTPVVTLGLRDRDAGTVTLTTSFGNWRKLARVERDPHVTLVCGNREHGRGSSPMLVMAQGDAEFPDEPDMVYLMSQVAPRGAKRLHVPKQTRFWTWVGREYFQARVPITITVRRLSCWPDTGGAGAPEVTGEPAAPPPAPQAPPKNGTGPRLGVAKTAKLLGTVQHLVLGWCGSDGYPEVANVSIGGTDGHGLILTTESGIVPEGGRRAGLLGHSFGPRLVGMESRVFTGWMENDGGRIVYAPHTKAGYKVPPRQNVIDLASGISAKLGMREARKLGKVNEGRWVRDSETAGAEA